MAKLTKEELSKLKSLGISKDETLDASGFTSKAERKKAAHDHGAKVTYGYTPHFKCGFCLKTPSGNCIVCDPKYLAYAQRHKAGGTLYIAYSSEKGYIKVGSSTKITDRSMSIRHQTYGGFSDWVISFSTTVQKSAGAIEIEMQQSIKEFLVNAEYLKDGKKQRTKEMFNYPVEKAIRELKQIIEKHSK